MTSSEIEDLDGLGDVTEIAARLCGNPIKLINPVTGGGNNRLYRVETKDGCFALKSYPPLIDGAHNRLKAEFDGLNFLKTHGITCVPDVIDFDAEKRYALYQWIEGKRIKTPSEADIEAATEFIDELKELSSGSASGEIGGAAEACLSARELVAQVEKRLSRLNQEASDGTELGRFLSLEVAPFFKYALERAQQMYVKLKWDFEAELPRLSQTLSPSDFGFHNALKTESGQIIFIDFEYFGWDDPVRLVADFMLHPGMNLTNKNINFFIQKCGYAFGLEDSFKHRFDCLYPLIGVRWCMILLNEFISVKWALRRFAGHNDQKKVQQIQLKKSQNLLKQISAI